jgi:hypothetical protein
MGAPSRVGESAMVGSGIGPVAEKERIGELDVPLSWG